jgi:RNA-directed DNA polymerase
LTINESKSAVTSVFGRKFLGYALWEAKGGDVRRGISAKALGAFKQRIRQLTRRNGGRSISQVVAYLRRYLLGWQGYFKLSQTPRIWRSLDGWIRRRLRALHLKQWRRGKTIYRELMRLGATPRVAQSVAALSRRWWHNSLSGVHHVLTRLIHEADLKTKIADGILLRNQNVPARI